MRTTDFKCPICGGPNTQEEKKGSLAGGREIRYSCQNENCRTKLYQVYDKKISDYLPGIRLERTNRADSEKWKLYGNEALTVEQWEKAAKGEYQSDSKPSPAVSASGTSVMSQAALAGSKFGTLLGYGSLLKGLGRIIVVLAVIIAFVGLSVREVGLIFGLAGAIALAITGIGLMASGEVISCFVSIEQNTRNSAELLERLLKASH